MMKLLAASTKFVRDEEGASLVEYGLLLSLVAVVCIVAITRSAPASPTCSPNWPATSERSAEFYSLSHDRHRQEKFR